MASQPPAITNSGDPRDNPCNKRLRKASSARQEPRPSHCRTPASRRRFVVGPGKDRPQRAAVVGHGGRDRHGETRHGRPPGPGPDLKRPPDERWERPEERTETPRAGTHPSRRGEVGAVVRLARETSGTHAPNPRWSVSTAPPVESAPSAQRGLRSRSTPRAPARITSRRLASRCTFFGDFGISGFGVCPRSGKRMQALDRQEPFGDETGATRRALSACERQTSFAWKCRCGKETTRRRRGCGARAT